MSETANTTATETPEVEEQKPQTRTVEGITETRIECAIPLYEMIANPEWKEGSDAPKKVQKFRESLALNLFTLGAFYPELAEVPFNVTFTELPDGNWTASINYKDSKLDYMQDALTARQISAAKGRNTAGNEPAATVEELVSGGSRTGIKTLIRQFRDAATSYLVEKGNKPGLVKKKVKWFDLEQLEGAAQAKKDMALAYLQKFAELEGFQEHKAAIDRLIEEASKAEDEEETAGELEL